MAVYPSIPAGTAAAAGTSTLIGSATVGSADSITAGTAAASAAVTPTTSTSTAVVGSAVVGSAVVGSAAGPAPLVPFDQDAANYPFRRSYALWYTVDATIGGMPVPGAQGLQPTGGSVTDTTKPGVRRVLNVDFAPTPGLYDLLAPTGTRLTVTAHVRRTDRHVQDIPMGVFSVDSETLGTGGGKLSLTAPDKWVLIQRSKLIGPATSTPGILVTDQIRQLITSALGGQETVVVTATSTARMGAQTWAEDRAQAILDLATSIGAWVYCDRNGVFTIADMPVIGADANWLVAATTNGVLITADRSKSRTNTANVVLVESTASAGETFPIQFLFDSDPASPTYAGTNPVANPGSAGPFGISVYTYSTSLPLSIPQAQALGRAILAKTVGLASQVTVTQVPNPQVNAFDVIDVLFPKERYDVPQALERHVIDTVTHPLDVSQAQQIAGRSTRSDPYQ